MLVFWWGVMVESGTRSGRLFHMAVQLPGMLRDAGFVDVEVRREPWVLTAWPESAQLNELGRWGRESLGESVSSYSAHFLMHVLGWSEERVRETVRGVLDEVYDPKSRYWVPM